LSTFSALFGGSAAKAARDDDKLMDLYWNRNELKKEFARLREDNFKLKDRVSSYQGDLARLEQKLQHLEELLIDPEWARSILVLYQLRGLGQRCTRKVARFAEQLKQQHEHKQRGSALAKWRAGMESELAEFDAEIGRIDQRRQAVESELNDLRQSLAASRSMFGIFRRRRLRKRGGRCAQEIASLHQEKTACLQQLQTIKSQQPPATMGLSLAAKRSINFMIVAFAQQLYLAFDDDEIAGLVKESLERSVGGVRYGNAEDCERLLGRIQRSSQRLDQPADFAGALQRRSRLLSDAAVYQNDGDAVPLAGTVAMLCRFEDNGPVRTTDLDLLSGNVWGLATVLSR